MANNQIRVSLLLNADTKSAQNSLNQLGASLAKISNAKIGVQNGPIQQAAQSARELEIHLSKAMNANTGKLDLGKFTASLQQSGQSLSTLTSRLTSIGPQGQQAFVQLANSIARAQMPATQLSGAITKVLKTFGSAALWRMAYGGINAVSKSFKDAVGYVKNFDKALTDIAIVSDMTDKQLARFAKSASVAAKELKTTAVEYSKAALIFYQQGLDGSEVAERTEATIKMAQVTGESAKTVSDQLTAIWNNFDDGSKSLEYYADVITALGAATASSSQEIAEGLEKFAAIAETVGLSYEYATTALATVTAETRQSADVVGTAFKTLFARIQDLELGETLEDGVTLGQYSKALDAIGVSVIKSNGELRDMDDILNDLGDQWDYISDAQKVAVAQTVGGTRQYAQLMALMDNWDTFEINLAIAEGSEGTLDKQNERWKKSAEAAAAEVDQAWENLYSKLLNSDLVVGFTSGLADVINTIGGVIDAFGGIGPVILTIVGLFANSLMPIITQVAGNLRNNFRVAFGFAAKDAKNFVSTFESDVKRLASEGYLNESYAEQARLSGELLKTKAALEQASASVTEQEKAELEARYKIIEALTDQAQAYLQAKDAATEQAEAARAQISSGKGAKDLTDAARAYADQKANEEFNYDEEIEKNKKRKEEAIGRRNKIQTQLEGKELSDKEKAALENIVTQADKKLEDLEAQKQKITTSLGEASAAKFEAENSKKSIKKVLKTEGLTAEERANYEKQLANATAEIKKQEELIQQANKELSENNTSSVEIKQSRIEAQNALNNNPLTDEQKAELEKELAQANTEIEKLTHENRSLNTKKGNITKDNKVMSLNANEKILGRAELDLDTDARISSRTIGEKFDKAIIQQEWSKMGAKGKHASVAMEFSVDTYTQKIEDQIKYKNVIEDSQTALKELQMLEEKGQRLVKSDSSFAELETAGAEVDALEKEKARLENKIKKDQELLDKGGLTDKKEANAKARITANQEALKKAEEDLAAAQNKRKQAMDNLSNEGKEYLNDLKAQQTQFETLAKSLGFTDDQLKEFGFTQEQLSKLSPADQVKLLNQRFSELKNGADLADGAIEDLLNSMVQLLKKQGIDTAPLEELKRKLNEANNATRDAARTQEELNRQRDNFNKKLSVSTDSFANAIGAIGQYAGSIMSAVSAFKMLTDAFREGASPMERITGILMGLSMLLPIVSQAFKIMNDEQAKGQLIDLLNVISGKARLKVTKDQTKANNEEAASQDKVNKEVQENTTSDAANAATKGGGLGRAFLSAMPTLLAATAAIAVVVGTVKTAKNQLSKYEEAADRAQQQSENLTEAYKNAETEQNNLNNSLDKYDNAIEKTKTLTKGTNEYIDALNEANSAALELIQNYDDLQYSIVDGVMMIDKESRTLAVQRQREKAANAQAAQLIGQNTAGYANSQQVQAEFARENLQSIRGDLINAGNIAAATAAGATAGALIGIVIPGIGNAIGAAVGAIVGAVGGLITGIVGVVKNGSRTDAEEKALDDIAAYIKKTGDQSIFENDETFKKFLTSKLKIDDNRLVDSLMQNRKAVQDLTAVEVARLKQEEARWELALNSKLQSNALYSNSDFQDFILKSAQKARVEDEKIAEQHWDNMSKSQRKEAYLKTMGLNSDQYKIDDNKLYIIDESTGAWTEKGDVDNEQMKRSYIQKYSVDQVSNTDIYKLNQEAEYLANQLEKAGITNSGNQRKILSTYAETDKEAAQLQGMRAEEVRSIEANLNKIQDTQLKAAMAQAVDVYWKNLPEVFSTDIFDEWYNNLSEEDKSFVWTMDIDKDATMDQVKNLFDQINDYSKGVQLNLAIDKTDSVIEKLQSGRFSLDANGQAVDIVENLFNNIEEMPTELIKLFDASGNREEAIAKAKALDTAQIVKILSGAKAGLIDQATVQNYATSKDIQNNIDDKKIELEEKQERINYQRDTVLKDVEANREYANQQIINSLRNLYAGTTQGQAFENDVALGFSAEQLYNRYGNQAQWAVNARSGQLGEEDRKLIGQADYFFDSLSDIDRLESQAEGDFERLSSEAGEIENEIAELEQKLENNKTSQRIATTEQLIANSEQLGINTEELTNYASELRKTAKSSNILDDALAEDTAALYETAQMAKRLNKGIQDLHDNYEDWSTGLSTPQTSESYRNAMVGFQESVANLLDVEQELIDDNFILEHMDKIQNAAEGDAEAIEQLRIAYSKQFIINIVGSDKFAQVQNQFTALSAWAAEHPIKAGAFIDDATFIKQAQELVDTAGMVEEEVRRLFEGMDYTVQLGQDENGNVKILGATYKGRAKDFINPIRNDEKDKRDKKKLEEELERYHEILEIIEDLEREYEKLGKLKDRAFGQSHLDYLDAETSKLAERMEAQKEYLKEIEDYLVKDREAIMKYGVSLDEYGRITNYEELVAAQVNAYNSNPNDAQEEYYNKFKDELDQYEETLNLLEEQREVYFDQQNERFDKSLEKAEYVVEYGTSLVEDSLSIIEYQLEKIEDKAYSTAEALALMGQKMNEVSKKSDIYKESIETTLAASGLSIDDILGASPEELAELVANGTFTADQVEQLRNYRDELLNTNQEMKDMANETLDKLLEGFDEWNEAIDKNKEKIDHLKEVTSSYRDIIDLIGKDNLGVSNQMLKQMNEFNIAASQSQVDITRRQLEENKRSLEEAREEYRNAASEEEKYYWGQVVESLEETVMQGESDLLSATQDSLNTIQEAFKDTLTNITEEFEKAISGMYGSLEALQTAYDQRADERERYLEDYAKIYELSKLTRDINKSMDESDSIRGKQRLLEIQEEINALQESGVEMTQFEVDELRARYDLRLAEIALEEAQNAKSQVRMTRDSEGNWSYTYTADQDAIDNAQQNYEDKLYAYQNLTTEYIYDLESQIMEIPSQLSEALKAIWEDTTLTDEEKEARAQEAIDFYTQKDAFLKEQMEKAIGRSKELYDKDWKNYSNATGYKISADEQWMDSFDETVLSQITGFKTLEEYQQAFAGSAMTMANDMRTAYQTMTSNIDKTLQNMGTSMTTFAQDLQGLMNTNKQKIEEYTKEVDDDIEKMGTSSADAMKKAADNWALYADYVANSAGANEDLATALNNVIEAIGNLSAPLGILSEQYQKVEQDARAALQAAQDLANYGGPQINLTPGTDSWAGGTFKGTIVNWEDPSRLLTSAGSQFIRVSGSGNHARYVRYSDAIDNGRLLGNKLQITENLTLFTLRNGHMVDKFDTGGYTGSWDSSGRLAMLHQKELVLNADDTKNFLAAVNIVRELSAAIDLKALAYQNALGQMSGAIRMSHEPQRLQQDVTIHAEFPNVTERNEIEAAFNSLMNQATQYVYRK